MLAGVLQLELELREECLVLELVDVGAPHVRQLEQRSVQLRLVDELVSLRHRALRLGCLILLSVRLRLLVFLVNEELFCITSIGLEFLLDDLL